MMLVLGWSLSQFAHAKVYHKVVTSEEVPATIKGANAVMTTWRQHRLDYPCEITIVGAVPIFDFPWATRMFEVVSHGQPGCLR